MWSGCARRSATVATARPISTPSWWRPRSPRYAPRAHAWVSTRNDPRAYRPDRAGPADHDGDARAAHGRGQVGVHGSSPAAGLERLQLVGGPGGPRGGVWRAP